MVQLFIAAVELELPPVTTTAVVLQAPHQRIEWLAWDLRREGWLPKGASPLPGVDRGPWLETARRMLDARQSELIACQRQREQRVELARSRRNAKRSEQRSNERALRPSKYVLDQFPLL